jgi:DNA-binding NarL/FixJ family response regulator
MQTPIKIVVVENEQRVRESLVQKINCEPGLCCVNNYSSAEDALAGIVKDRPDVVLMEIELPAMDGIECVRQLRAALPHLQFLMFTVCEESKTILDSFFAGADGYLLKCTHSTKLFDAIRQVASGGSPMSSSVARKVVSYFNKLGENKPTPMVLSPHEQKVLELLFKGVTYKGISEELSLSVGAIRMHTKHIFAKLHVHSRGEVVAKYALTKLNELERRLAISTISKNNALGFSAKCRQLSES